MCMKSTTPAGRPSRGLVPPLREHDETDVSAEQHTTQAHTRFSGSHEQPRRTSDPEAPARQGAQALDGQYSPEATGVTRRVGNQRFSKSTRLRKRTEFLRLQHGGQRRARACFVVITKPRRGEESRLGITVSRRVGGAVTRNRVKRFVREFFRRYRHRVRPARDVLVIARPPAASASYADVKEELAAALHINDRH